MTQLLKIGLTIIGAYVGVYLVGLIFSFFDIGFSSYGPYMLFALALALFNAVLPSTVGQMFMHKS